MRGLLLVHHTPSPAMQAMFESVRSGARTDEIDDVEVAVLPALTAGAADVLGADGYLLKSLEAREFFELLGGLSEGLSAISRPLAGKILRELARDPAPQRSADDPTEREEEILRLLAQGASNREIATALVISENTVKYHMKNILDKLHLRNRAQVIAYAARHASLDDT